MALCCEVKAEPEYIFFSQYCHTDTLIMNKTLGTILIRKASHGKELKSSCTKKDSKTKPCNNNDENLAQWGKPNYPVDSNKCTSGKITF